MSDKTEDKPDLKAGAAPARDRENMMMPQAPDLEKSILSMMTMDPETVIPQCVEAGLTEDYFYIPAHRILWNLFQERYDARLALDLTTVAQVLTDRNLLESVGGRPGLLDVYTFSTSTALFNHHMETLREKYIRRCIVHTSNAASAAAYTGDTEVAELLDQTEQAVLQIRQNTEEGKKKWSLKQDIQSFMDTVERLMHGGDRLQGLSTGFDKLDRDSNGLKPGELFVVAARPSMGKTSFLLNIIEHLIIKEKKAVLMFSCEMPSTQLVERLILSLSGISKQEILMKRSGMTKGDLKKITDAVRLLKAARLTIDDTAGISIAELRAKARRVKREQPDLACIGIDYLQLMRSHTKQAQNSREREIAEISGGLKNLAKELEIPIIVLAQLNRGPENRPGKSKGLPMMSDLRESGAIEQDADMIGLLYRTAYYAENEEQRQAAGQRANLLLAKNRNGPTGDVPLSFVAELMRFVPRVPDEADEGD